MIVFPVHRVFFFEKKILLSSMGVEFCVVIQ